MSGGYAYKYTDADLRRDPRLLDLATEYLEEYVGEFPFLITARTMYVMNGEIPLPVARGVLNCARVDPLWQNRLPEPYLQVLQNAVQLAEVITLHEDKQATTTRRQRPVKIECDSIFAPIYVSAWHKAQYFHLVDDVYSRVWYWPHSYEPFERRFQMDVILRCGARLNTGGPTKQQPPAHLDLCPKCAAYC